MGDQQIIELLFARSETGICELEQQYGKLVRLVAGNVLDNAEDVGECVNDTWMAVWNTIPPQRPQSLSGYVCRISKNIALRRYRDAHRKKRNGVMVALEEFAESLSGRTLEEDYSVQSLIEGINTYLGLLEKENRLIWLAYYWAVEGVPQIAARMGMTKSAVTTRLSRTKKGMWDYLKKEELL
jgi:RNA polymerase sigma-70 factor (ECF subfamily)